MSDVSDPEKRALSGHPDHPPTGPDQSVEKNQDLLRGADQGESGDEGETSPGDEASTLPGYG